MISNQIIQTSIDELKGITKVDFAVFDTSGETLATTFDISEIEQGVLSGFAESPADSQVIGHHHLLKIYDDDEVQFILDARGLGDDAYTMGRVAVCQ